MRRLQGLCKGGMHWIEVRITEVAKLVQLLWDHEDVIAIEHKSFVWSMVPN